MSSEHALRNALAAAVLIGSAACVVVGVACTVLASKPAEPVRFDFATPYAETAAPVPDWVRPFRIWCFEDGGEIKVKCVGSVLFCEAEPDTLGALEVLSARVDGCEVLGDFMGHGTDNGKRWCAYAFDESALGGRSPRCLSLTLRRVLPSGARDIVHWEGDAVWQS